MKLNCSFQYATGSPNAVYVDTDLITRQDAERKFKECINMFMDHLEAGMEPEMVIWINMEDEHSYGDKAEHWHHSEFITMNGQLYRQVDV